MAQRDSRGLINSQNSSFEPTPRHYRAGLGTPDRIEADKAVMLALPR
ncbi:MAG: hypothetical protein ACRDRG_00550 [Pseudonocardiaceae bacterium]